MKTVTLLVLDMIITVLGCHPECTDPCSNTVCPASCRAIIEHPPNCTITCNNDTANGYASYCQNPICESYVPVDQCESDQCPVAGILCQELQCTGLPTNVTCEVICQPLMSAWLCGPPLLCPNICNLRCESPACAYNGPPVSPGLTLIHWVLFMFLAVVVLVDVLCHG